MDNLSEMLDYVLVCSVIQWNYVHPDHKAIEELDKVRQMLESAGIDSVEQLEEVIAIAFRDENR
jgi:hypothetical protein